MKVFGKLLVANFRQFSRERTALFFTFFFPIMFMLIFGLVFGGMGDYVTPPIGVVAPGDSVYGGIIIETLDTAGIGELVPGNLEDNLEALRSGDLGVVVEIPEDIDAEVAAAGSATITIHHDPADTDNFWQPSVIQQIINEISYGISGHLPLLAVNQVAIEPGVGSDAEFWSQGGRVIDFMVPGILAMSVLFLGLQGVMPIVEWRENKTLKRLGASPLNRGYIVYSQIAMRVVLSVIQALLIIVIARLVFDVQVLGNWWLLFGMLMLGTLALISIGFLLVARAQTVEGATPLIMGVQFPMMFLSGIFFPTDMMPSFMEPIMAALPLTYLGDAFRQIMVNATPMYPLWVCAAVLGGWLVVTMALTVRFFKWE